MLTSSLRLPPLRGLPALLALWPLLLALGAGYCVLHAWLGAASQAPGSQTLAWTVASVSGWWLAVPWLRQALRGRGTRGALRIGAYARVLAAVALAITVEWLLRRLLGGYGLDAVPWLAIAHRVLPVALLLVLVRLLLDAGRGDRGPDLFAASDTLADARRPEVTTAAPAPDGGCAATHLTAWRGTQRVEMALDAIRWISAEENYVALHGDDGSAPLLRSTLAAMAQQLGPAGFIRVHRRLLVRRAAIRARLGATRLQLEDGTVLPIGRSYRAGLHLP